MQNKEQAQKRIRELRTMPYEEYLKTPEWAQKREQALERDGYCCRVCNSGKNLNVHHRTYARRGNEDLNDLTTLCQSCHEYFHEKMSQEEIMVQTYDPPRLSEEERAQKLEHHLLGLLIQDLDVYPHVGGLLSKGDFLSEDTWALYQWLGSVSSDKPFDQCIPPELGDVVSRAAKEIKTDIVITKEKRISAVVEIAIRMRRANLVRIGKKLHARIMEAAASGDKVVERELRARSLENMRLIRTIDIAKNVG